ncbi:MAG: class I SAM-dependent methyltransferase [Prochlorotrichaceae cyanobacterium]
MNLALVLQNHLEHQSTAQIPFIEFMDWALYHSQAGYYSQGKGLGKRGDFFTAVHLGIDFGELLAQQLVDCWHQLHCPTPFMVVEMGGGEGFLAQDILGWIAKSSPPCYRSLCYRIIERSPGLRQQQQEQLRDYLIDEETDPQSSFDRLNWLNWDELADNSVVGCFFSNELVDAFPVHQVIAQDGELQEVYVTWKNDRWQEEYGPLSSDRLIHYFREQNLDLTHPPYPNPYRTEVNLAAQEWLKTIATKLKIGYVITIDYGYDRDRYYHPQRSQGTLQCYYQHRRHDNPYVNLGEQDITAHVNFTDLQRWGEAIGLKTLGWTRQALFLMALGLGDRLQALSLHPHTLSSLLQRRDALHQLLDPGGLGNFWVLIQGKGLTEAQAKLQGLKQD